MSLILEALKKSDAERQRTRERPTAMDAPGPASHGRLLVLVAAVALSLAGGWYLANLTQTGQTISAPTPQATAAQRPDVTVPPASPASPASEGDSGDTETLTPSNDTAVIESSQTPENIASQPPPAVVTVDVNKPAPVPIRTDERADAAASPALEGPANWTPVPARTPAESRPRPLEEISRPPELQQRGVDVRPLPTLGQLPSSVRTEVGSLTLNIHVFDEQPENRFVLINLKRRVEGDTVAPDLRLIEIRPDGAVLDYRGMTFLLASAL